MWQQREQSSSYKMAANDAANPRANPRKHSFAYFGNEITNDCPSVLLLSHSPHLSLCLSSHISHFTRDISHSLSLPFRIPFATFRRVTPTAAAAACHIKGLFYVTCCLHVSISPLLHRQLEPSSSHGAVAGNVHKASKIKPNGVGS